MRTKFILPFIVICTVLSLFTIFLFDTVLKSVMISAGEMAFGAKVEIQSVKTRIKGLSVNIHGVKIANKNNVMFNLADIDNIHFSMQPIPLLSKKFIIDDMSIEGLHWGTPRQVSGALPPRKQKKVNKNNSKSNSLVSGLMNNLKSKASSEVKALPSLQNIEKVKEELNNFSTENVLSQVDLTSLKVIADLQTDYNSKFSSYNAKLKELDIDTKVSKLQPVLNEVKDLKINNIQDLPKAKSAVDKLNLAKSDIDTAYSGINSIKDSFSKDIADSKNLIKAIETAKDNDLAKVRDTLKLPSLSFENAAMSIFGPVWVQRSQSFLYYLHLVQKYMPKKDLTKKKLVSQRLKGMDVSFPLANKPPALWIKQISLSGSTGGSGKTVNPLEFKGIISDITSDQSLIGKSTLISISGAQGARLLKIDGTLDHRTDDSKDSFSVIFNGIDTKSMVQLDSDYLPDMSQAVSNLNMNVVLANGKYEANLTMDIGNMKPLNAEGNSSKEIVNSLWKNVPKINIYAKVSGDEKNTDISVTSDIDRMLSERLKGIFGEKLAQAQDKLKAEINKYTDAQKNELLKSIDAQKAELLAKLGLNDKLIKDKLGLIESKKSELENSVKSQSDNEKKKAEDDLKKQAEEKLRDIFK